MRGGSEFDFELERVVKPKSRAQFLRFHQNRVGGAVGKAPLFQRLVRYCVFASLQVKVSLRPALDPLLHVFNVILGRVVPTPGTIGRIHQTLFARIQLRILT